jgi:hypothetical protein
MRSVEYAEAFARVRNRRPLRDRTPAVVCGAGEGSRENEMITLRIKAFFRALYRTARKILLEGNRQWIPLSENSLYVRIPDLRFRLSSSGNGAMDLSLPETRAFFASIKTACERQEIVHFRTKDLSWTTDGSLQANKPDDIVVKFGGTLGLGRVGLSRQEALSACREFDNLFGQTSTMSREVTENG